MTNAPRPLLLLVLLLCALVGMDLDAYGQRGRSSGGSARSSQGSRGASPRSTPSRPSRSTPSPSRSVRPSPSPSRSRSVPTPSRPSPSPSYSRPSSPSRSAPSYDRGSSSYGRSGSSYDRGSSGYDRGSSGSYTRTVEPDRSSSDALQRLRERYDAPSAADRAPSPPSSTRTSPLDRSRPLGEGAPSTGVIDISDAAVVPRTPFPRAYRGPEAEAPVREVRPSFEPRTQPGGRTTPRFTSGSRSLSSSDLLTRYGATTRANPTRSGPPPADSDLLSSRRRAALRDAAAARGADDRGIASRERGDTRTTRDQSALRERWLQSPEGQSALARSGRLVRDDVETARRVADVSEGLARATEGALRAGARLGSLGVADAVPIGDVAPGANGRDPGSDYDDGYDDGYGDGYDDGYRDGRFDHPFWWGYANFWCGSPFWNNWGYTWSYWGWGWGPGWGACWNWGWNWYWYDCGLAWWAPFGWRNTFWPRTSIFVPSVSYTTVVHETVYQDPGPGGAIAYPPEERYVELEGTPSTVRGGSGSVARRFIGEAVADQPEGMGRLNRAAEYYLVLGDRAFYEGRYGATVHYYAKAIEFAPDEGMLYLLLSDALFATGDYGYAAFALRKAFELEPGLATNVLDKRTLYADPTEFDSQLARLEEFLRDHPLDEDARLVLATNYLFSSRPSEAAALLQDEAGTTLATTPAGELILGSATALLAR